MRQPKFLCVILGVIFAVLLATPQPVMGKVTFKSPTAKTICINKSFKIQWEFTPKLSREFKKVTVVLCRNGKELSTLKTMLSTHCCRHTNACCYFHWMFKGAPFIGPKFTFKIIGHRADKTKSNLGVSHEFYISKCTPKLKRKIDPRRKLYKKPLPQASKPPTALDKVFKITKVTLEAIPTALEVTPINNERKKVYAEAYITVMGKGKVDYEWISYNRGIAGRGTLVFEKSGTQRIDTSDEWHCRHHDIGYSWRKFWFTLHITAPEEITKTVNYKVRCQKASQE